MNTLFNLLRKTRTEKETSSLQAYRIYRESAFREFELEKERAQKDLDDAMAVPLAIYRNRLNSARLDFERIEQELWNEHLLQVNYVR